MCQLSGPGFPSTVESVRPPTFSDRAPLIVVEDQTGYRAVADEVAGAGWTLVPPGSPIQPGTLVAMDVTDPAGAQAAVLEAMRGIGVLVRADGERAVIDDLVEDLAHIGQVRRIDGGHAIELEPDTWRLVHALAAGTTVSVAARSLHLSVRTANRRIADAKEVIGVQTRAQLLRSLTAHGRVPAAKVSR
jgi:hypothetical protein